MDLPEGYSVLFVGKDGKYRFVLVDPRKQWIKEYAVHVEGVLGFTIPERKFDFALLATIERDAWKDAWEEKAKSTL